MPPENVLAVLAVLDLLGVFVFALSGATLAVAKRLDVFGVLVLAAVAALGGGLLRDVLLDVPPVALEDARYLVVTFVAGVAVFFFSRLVERLRRAVRLFDAFGLGLFVSVGTLKALDAGPGTAGAVTLGVLTGVGGGLLRDVLVGEVPSVLRREVYAVPAMLGALLLVVARGQDVPRAPAAIACAALVIALRVLGMAQGLARAGGAAAPGHGLGLLRRVPQSAQRRRAPGLSTAQLTQSQAGRGPGSGARGAGGRAGVRLVVQVVMSDMGVSSLGSGPSVRDARCAQVTRRLRPR